MQVQEQYKNEMQRVLLEPDQGLLYDPFFTEHT